MGNNDSNSSTKGIKFILIFFFVTLISFNVIYYNARKLTGIHQDLVNIGKKVVEIEQTNANERVRLLEKEKLAAQLKLEEQAKLNEAKPIDINAPVEISRTSELLKENFNYTNLRTSIWQTAPTKVEEKIEKLMGTWKQVPHWTYNFMDDNAVKDHLQSSYPKLNITKLLQERAILAYDLFRYSIIYREGGMYADSDIEKADQFEDSMTNLRECNIIVGIEADYRTDPEWMNKFPRSLQISQWSFYAKERHPMMKYVVDRVVDKIWWLQQKGRNLYDEDVMEVTGPGIWTDSVMDYISINTGVNIKEYMKCGQSYRFKDVCVLNVKGVATTMPHSDCKTETNENSYIINLHHFLGSWKHD